MTDDLVRALRKTPGWPTLGNAAADRIEELEKQLLKAERMLEREIRRVQKIRADIKPPHKVDLKHVVEEYQLMLDELRGQFNA